MKELIEKQIGQDPFHQAQYGFRRRMGTTEATCEVARLAETSSAKELKMHYGNGRCKECIQHPPVGRYYERAWG